MTAPLIFVDGMPAIPGQVRGDDPQVLTLVRIFGAAYDTVKIARHGEGILVAVLADGSGPAQQILARKTAGTWWPDRIRLCGAGADVVALDPVDEGADDLAKAQVDALVRLAALPLPHGVQEYARKVGGAPQP